MTIDVRGCEIVAFSAEELAQAQALEGVFSALATLRAGLATGTLEVEFAKAFAVGNDERVPSAFADGEPFFVMQVRASARSRLAPEEVHLYLTQMAFNAAAGTVCEWPPVLVRYFRGDMMNRGYDVISDMFTPK